MSAQAVDSVSGEHLGVERDVLRVGFLGAATWLDGCAPTALAGRMTPRRFDVAPDGAGAEHVRDAIERFRPAVAVVFDPPSLPPDLLAGLAGLTLGVLVDRPASAAGSALSALDRVVSFDPSLTGERVGRSVLWRAIPPPVSDALYAQPRERRRAPRAMSIGRSSEHRERMLMPAKHHHDLLQVIQGVTGAALRELLAECDVGVYVARDPGGRYAHQVGVHLAAGQLLLSEELTPAHGLERNIDYLTIESPDGLVWALERLARFPEMYRAIRVRGHLKSHQYRASRVFSRLLHDLQADVGAFG